MGLQSGWIPLGNTQDTHGYTHTLGQHCIKKKGGEGTVRIGGEEKTATKFGDKFRRDRTTTCNIFPFLGLKLPVPLETLGVRKWFIDKYGPISPRYFPVLEFGCILAVGKAINRVF